MKGGVSELELQKAVLECGSPAPYASGPDIKRFFDNPSQDWPDRLATMELCMLKSGFSFRRGLTATCKERPTLRACQPENAHLIPTRDPERRMNSVFCKAYPKADACQP